MENTKATVGAKEVQALNAKISKLNTQRTEIATKISMYKANLAEELKNYLSAFGVDLSGKTLGETKKLVMAEFEKVNASVMEEYQLKNRVVECIEEGDIEEANRLLGIAVEEPEETYEEDSTDDAVEDIGEDEDAEDFSVDDLSLDDAEGSIEDSAGGFGGFGVEGSSEEEDASSGSAESEEDVEDDFKFWIEPDSEGSDTDEDKGTDSEDYGDLDESDEEDFGFGDLSVAEDEPKEAKTGFEDGDFSVDDLSVDDEEEEDFGFADLLGKGNKF